MPGLEIIREIEIAGPFRLATALNVVRPNGTPPFPINGASETHFSIEVPGGAIETKITQDAPGENPLLTICGSLVTDEIFDWIETRVRHMFSLNISPEPFFEKANSITHTRKALAVCPDLRPVLFITPFEGAISSIISYANSPRSSSMLMNNLCEVCGIVPEGLTSAQPAFPGKFTLLAVPETLLEIAGLPEEKIKAIKKVCTHLVGDPDPLERMEKLNSLNNALAKLETFPGMNRAIAMKMLQHSYGYLDLLLDTPLLRKAVMKYYELPDLPDSSTILRLAEPFKGWRSWWTFLLLTANKTSVIV